MGKQTKISDSNFGGDWTKEKLLIISEYLAFYVKALSKQNFKLVYIDAFAGSGKTNLRNGEEIDGSALISLKYDFSEYYFIEISEQRALELQTKIKESFPEKINKINIIQGDSNKELVKILDKLDGYSRCVLFLDPYALELEWAVLETIKEKTIIDIWYLFPLNALIRNLPKKEISSNKELINKILGTLEWEDQLYQCSPQICMFGDINERVEFEQLLKFIESRFTETFPYVSPKSKFLKNKKGSPLFILFFIMTNTSKKAINLGNKVAGAIFDKINKLQV